MGVSGGSHEHTDPATGFVVQQTTTGTAVYRRDINTPIFTTSTATDHWAVTPDGFLHWTNDSDDPLAKYLDKLPANNQTNSVTAPAPPPIPDSGAVTPTQPPVEVAPPPAASPNPIDPNSVDITLLPSRDTLIAGDLWAVTGEIHNRSKDKPIWIVDKKTALMFAPEVLGPSIGTFTLIADFPTVFYDPTVRYHATWIKIDPGSSYAVTWRFNSPSNPNQSYSCTPAFSDFGQTPTEIYNGSVFSIWDNYRYFSPGTFKATATVHVWYEQPSDFDDSKCVVPLTNSFPVTLSKDLMISSPPWVLIVGAALGGFACRTLQIFAGDVRSSFRGKSIVSGGLAVGGYLVGYIPAVLLSGVATVLFSRLSTSEFPVAVKVNDIWGAFATGFVVQFLGYSWFKNRLLGQASATGTPSAALDRNQFSRQDVQAGASIRISGRGLPTDARIGSVVLLAQAGQAIILTPEAGSPLVTAGTFEGSYRLPPDLAPAQYDVNVNPTAGAVIASSNKLTIAAQ